MRLLAAKLTAFLALACLLPTVAAAQSKLPLTSDAAKLVDWVTRSQDNVGLPFVVIDKRQAHVWVFNHSAKPLGDAPVLLGMARGDHTAPGVGDLQLADIKFSDRTTPAGRFVAEIGTNARGEDVVWVDYDAGVSMHRVLTTNAKERRAERLATPTPSDNRVSFGCINVPKGFFETTLIKTVNRGNSIVYIIPETQPLERVFAGIASTSMPKAPALSTRTQ